MYTYIYIEKIIDKKEENINKEKKGSSFFKRSSIDNDLGADLQF
jgi:hypothetical protein